MHPEGFLLRMYSMRQGAQSVFIDSVSSLKHVSHGTFADEGKRDPNERSFMIIYLKHQSMQVNTKTGIRIMTDFGHLHVADFSQSW